MRVICPHCQTIYQLETTETDAVLVCARCGTEFGMGEMPADAQQVDATSIADTQTAEMFSENTSNEKTTDEATADPGTTEEYISGKDDTTTDNTQDDESFAEIENAQTENEEPESQTEQDNEANNTDDYTLTQAETDESPEDHPDELSSTNEDQDIEPVIVPASEKWIDDDSSVPPESDLVETTDSPPPSSPPPRAKLRIMPWLMGVIFLIAGTGFWLNHDAWMDDPWLRSVMLNIGLDIEVRDKDWLVDPDSVSATWLTRSDKETVLVITGEVNNLLQTDLLPPNIHFTLFARDNPDELILERNLIITRPPLMQAIRQAPYMPPARDNTKIPALGKRGFVLVLEDMPQNAGNFSLLGKAR